MVCSASLDQVTNKELLYEWNRFACANDGSTPRRGRKYLLPICAPVVEDTGVAREEDEDEDEDGTLICKNALTGLLNVGRRMWTKAMKCPWMVHKGTGKRSNFTI